MIKKTIELEYDLGDEVVIRVLKQRGIISLISINPGNYIRYNVEYGGGSECKSRWMDSFEIEKPVEGSKIGFVKEKK